MPGVPPTIQPVFSFTKSTPLQKYGTNVGFALLDVSQVAPASVVFANLPHLPLMYPVVELSIEIVFM